MRVQCQNCSQFYDKKDIMTQMLDLIEGIAQEDLVEHERKNPKLF
jgi:hypothetical protein